MEIRAKIEMDPRVKLRARRTLDGNIIILDHEDIDIVLLPKKNKCLTFPKESMSDKVYSAQDRMFKFLAKKGVISRSTVRGGNVFGSMEADVTESEIPGIDQTQALLYTLHEYINQERPYFTNSSEFDDDRLDHLLTPGEDDSTELGDVPHSDTKGSLDSKVRPYGFQYNYSLIREDESED